MKKDTIRISGLVEESIVDGPGIRYVIFSQGCRFACKGCHNPGTHPLDGGYEIAIDKLFDDIDKNPLLDGITISGGEPFLQAGACKNILDRLEVRGLNSIIYTGYRFEELLDKARENSLYFDVLSKTNLLVDGRFEEKKRDSSLRFRGSSNQRIVDVARSLDQGLTVEKIL